MLQDRVSLTCEQGVGRGGDEKEGWREMKKRGGVGEGWR